MRAGVPRPSRSADGAALTAAVVVAVDGPGGRFDRRCTGSGSGSSGRTLRIAPLGVVVFGVQLGELLFEAPPDELDAAETLVREAMEHPYPLEVPLVVGMGHGASWAEAH